MIELYAVGAVFTLGVLLVDDELFKLSWWKVVFVVLGCTLLWPLHLGICAGKAGLAGNKK